jgi:hypothetical protein
MESRASRPAFCKKSPDFQGFYRFFDLVTEPVLSKVRFLPD